jgi:hypothetical protein
MVGLLLVREASTRRVAKAVTLFPFPLQVATIEFMVKSGKIVLWNDPSVPVLVLPLIVAVTTVLEVKVAALPVKVNDITLAPLFGSEM